MVLERLKPIIEYVDQNRRFGRFDYFPLIVIYRRAFNKIIIKKYDMTHDLFLLNTWCAGLNYRRWIKKSILLIITW